MAQAAGNTRQRSHRKIQIEDVAIASEFFAMFGGFAAVKSLHHGAVGNALATGLGAFSSVNAVIFAVGAKMSYRKSHAEYWRVEFEEHMKELQKTSDLILSLRGASGLSLTFILRDGEKHARKLSNLSRKMNKKRRIVKGFRNLSEAYQWHKNDESEAARRRVIDSLQAQLGYQQA